MLAAALFVVLLIDPWAVHAAGFWLSFGAVAVIFYVTAGRIAHPNWIIAWLRIQWAIALGLVPLTLAGMLLPFDLVLQLAHLVMSWCNAFLEWLSALPSAVWQQHAPPAWVVVAAMIGALWMLLLRGFPARWIGIFGFFPLFLAVPPALPDGTLRVTVLDVGQGTRGRGADQPPHLAL